MILCRLSFVFCQHQIYTCVHSTVVEGAEKSQNDFFAFTDRFGYGKTNGKGIFHEFDQNRSFLGL